MGLALVVRLMPLVVLLVALLGARVMLTLAGGLLHLVGCLILMLLVRATSLESLVCFLGVMGSVLHFDGDYVVNLIIVYKMIPKVELFIMWILSK